MEDKIVEKIELTVSRKFPGTHNRKEDPTYFVEQIQNARFMAKLERERNNY
jgi:hypothetical protein